MTGLNYHHLRYFWTVAKEGSLRGAAEKLGVSPPSISAQISELEEALGEQLFRRSGRHNVLTEAGQVALRYAGEIFGLGQELVGAVQRRSDAPPLRFNVGVADSFPKLVTHDLLEPVFTMAQPVHVVCREGKLEDLLAQLVTHRLDVVLADEPASSGSPVRTFSQALGSSPTAVCAAGKLAAVLQRDFPRSLHQAPAMLPADNTALRRALEGWMRARGLEPRVVAEFEDLSLMKVMAADGRGFIVLPAVVADEAMRRYRFRRVGLIEDCRVQFHAITAERRAVHPAVVRLTQEANRRLRLELSVKV